jgi:ABC-type glycerol-3-phosphate transport system substrate-binding protein
MDKKTIGYCWKRQCLPCLERGKGLKRKPRIYLLFLHFLFCITLPLCSLELFANGDIWERYTNDTLNTLSYQVPVNGILMPGISLDELSPLFFEVDTLSIQTTYSDKSWKHDSIADNLTAAFIVKNGTSWDFFFGGELFSNIDSISLKGELLDTKKMEVWVSWEGVSQLKDEINRFADLHRIKVKAIDVPQIKSKLVSVLRGRGQPPDVVMVQTDYLPQLTQARALQGLNYLDIEGITGKGTQAFIREGTKWAIPFYFDTQLVYFNPELTITTPSIGWTLKDFEKICRELLNTGITPVSWNAYSAYWLIPFQMGFGKGKLIDAGGELTINDISTLNALSYILKLKDAGLLKIMERDGVVSLFAAGKIGMIISGSYSIPLFEELGIPFDVAPLPYNESTQKYLSPLLDFKGFAITQKTKNPIAARRLIEFLTGIGVQQRFPPAMAKLPVNSDALEVSGKNNLYFDILMKSLETGTIIPPDNAYIIYKNTMWKLLRFVFSDQMSVEDVLEEGQQIIDRKLELNETN